MLIMGQMIKFLYFEIIANVSSLDKLVIRLQVQFKLGNDADKHLILYKNVIFLSKHQKREQFMI